MGERKGKGIGIIEFGLFVGAVLILLLPLRGKERKPNPNVTRFNYIFSSIGALLKVPPSLLAAIADVESGGNPNARGRSGEIGLMQIKCDTAREMGMTGSCEDLLNPYVNVWYAARYLRYQYNRYGSWEKAISAYNAGRYTPANWRYVEKVLEAWKLYK